MEKRPFGNSDMHITTIGLGTWAIGGDGWPAAWGPQDDNESIETIQGALDLGINWIDTAAVYGLGHSEEVVGRALRGRAELPYIFTKCGRVVQSDRTIQGSLKAASIRQEVEASLRRLQVETIDLYQIHWPNPDEDIEEAWTTLAELKQEGKVRFIGVSNFSVEQLRRAQTIAPVTSLQPPYSLVRREIEKEVLPFCLEQQIGVIVYSPMMSGLLTGSMTRERAESLPTNDWRSRNPEFREPRLTRNLALVDLLSEISSHYEKSPWEVAIAWTLRHPAVTAAIVGGRRPGQVERIIGAADLHLSESDLARINDFLEANP